MCLMGNRGKELREKARATPRFISHDMAAEVVICLWCFLNVVTSTSTFKGGAKWFRYRVSIHHPLGFNWQPFSKVLVETCLLQKCQKVIQDQCVNAGVPHIYIYIICLKMYLYTIILKCGFHRSTYNLKILKCFC